MKKLQQQIEELIKERLHLESEMEFLKSQNTELRRGIAVLLEDNSKLESQLDVVEEEFEKQEKELNSATEETKVLLRYWSFTISNHGYLVILAFDFNENYQPINWLNFKNDV